MAKYTAVGPFVFKRDKKKPKSVKALKPVAAKEQRRAFAQVDAVADRAANRKAKAAAKKEKQNEAIRAYFGLKRSGVGSGRNPIVDLQTGRSRLTTPQERSQTVKTKKRYVETPKGFAVVGGGTARDPNGRALKPYGLTTLDERNRELRQSAANSRKYKERGAKLGEQKKKLQVKAYQQVATQGNTDKQVGQALKKVTDELQVRSRAERNTEAEGLLAALDNLSRPYYGVNAAAKAAVKGKRPDRVLGAAGRGLALKDKTESWDVLEAAGVKNKTLKYGLGIPASFATDPLSYVAAASAPVTGGSSLAALSPKAAKIASLTADANAARKLASASGKARHLRKADKAKARLDKALKGVQHGPLTAEDAAKVAERKSGIQLRVGARLPGTQKFVGVKTSGKTSANLRNKIPKTGPGSDARDVLVQHMAPTGRISSLTREESDRVVNAAAKKNAAIATAGVSRKAEQQAIDAAIRDDLGIGKLRRALQPRKTKKLVRSRSAELAEKYDAGEDIGKIGQYVEREMQKLLKTEREAGFDVSDLKVADDIDPVDIEQGRKRLDKLRTLADDPRAPKGERAAALKKYVDLDAKLRAAAEQSTWAKKYLPRYWKSQINKKARKAEKKIEKHESASNVKGSATNPQTPFGERRTVKTALKNLNEVPGDPRQFVKDLSGVVAKRKQASAEALASKELNDALVATGRKAKVGETTRALPTGYSVYKYENGRLSRVADDAVPEGSESHVVLKDAVKNRADELTAGSDDLRVPAGKVFDRVTGRWKGSVTVAWPGYYLRNLIGDTQLARQAGTDAKSAADSIRINRAVKKREKVIRSGKHITKGKDPEAALKKLQIKIEGKTYSGKELEELAQKSGAISTGQHGSEVSQLVGSEGFSATNRAARFNIRRENLPRRATFIADMKRGNSADDAAAFARREHYDYATRTEAQKQIRRVIPFYAWWDLNTRKQLRMMVQRPGKVNEIYHVMNGAASAAGYEDYRDYLASLPAGKQRGLPIPIVYGTNKDGTPKVKDVQFGNVLADSRAAFTKNPGKWQDELLSRGNPLLAKPLELGTNHSGFFRGEIEPDYAPWAKAPTALKGSVGKLGIDTKAEKLLGSEIVMRKDRKTGKMVPHYKKKTDYALRSLGPWAGFALNQSVKGEAGPFQKSDTDTLLGLTGISPSEHDPKTGQLDKLYRKRGELQKTSDGLSNVEGGTRRRRDLRRRINELTNRISAVEKDMGYADPLNTQGGRKKKYEGPLGEIQKLKDDFKKSSGLDEIQKLKKDLKKEIGSAGSSKPKKKTVAQRAGKPKLGTNNQDLRKLVRAEAVKNGLDPDLEEARIQQESGFQTSVTSSAGAQGVAQIMPGTAKSWGVNPNDPVAAIKVSSKKMAEYTKAHGSYENALVAYNAGPGRVGKPLFAETAGYIQNISKMAGKSANVKGGRGVSQKNLLKAGQSWGGKYGLKITSGYRDPKHNAAVGGVPNSYHTRGSKKNPAAIDLVGSEASMQRAAKAAQAAGFTTLIHDAGSGRHLHIQNDGAGGSSGSFTPSGGAQIVPASGGSQSLSTGRRSKSSANPTTGLTPEMIQQQRVLALLEYLQSSNKKSATRKLVRKRAIGELTTV